MAAPTRPWNINIHYDELLAALSPRGSRVLDVGCGDGFLAARLADQGCHVTAVDIDAPVLERARHRWAGYPVDWVQADVLSHAFEARSFDVVLSNATLHHLPDEVQALHTLGELVSPGGRLGVVGFARSGPRDWPMTAVCLVAIFVVVRVRHKWEHTAPQAWPPRLTYGQVKRLSGLALPGRSFRRLWLGRYLVTWTRPSTTRLRAARSNRGSGSATTGRQPSATEGLGSP